MTIKPITADDIEECARMYLRAYNQPPWNYNFTYEKAVKYLAEYFERKRFTGFVLMEGSQVAGALFGHAKTWWTNDLLYVDEFFISPDKQRLGYGKLLLDHTEKYARAQGYEVVALLTSKYMPAMKFYKSIDFIAAEHFVFLFKPLGTPSK